MSGCLSQREPFDLSVALCVSTHESLFNVTSLHSCMCLSLGRVTVTSLCAAQDTSIFFVRIVVWRSSSRVVCCTSHQPHIIHVLPDLRVTDGLTLSTARTRTTFGNCPFDMVAELALGGIS